MKTAIPLSFNKEYKPNEIAYVSITQKGASALKDWNKRAPAQRQVLETLLLKQKEIKVSTLKATIPSANSICKKLEDIGWLNIKHKPRVINPFDSMYPETFPSITLNKEQNAILKKMQATIKQDKFVPFLL